MTVVCVRVQRGMSCLYAASFNGHLEVVKYLYEVGGKELLKLNDNVSACGVRVWKVLATRKDACGVALRHIGKEHCSNCCTCVRVCV